MVLFRMWNIFEWVMCEMSDPGNIQGLYGSRRLPHCSQQSLQVYLQWQSMQQHMFSEMEFHSNDITEAGQHVVNGRDHMHRGNMFKMHMYTIYLVTWDSLTLFLNKVIDTLFITSLLWRLVTLEQKIMNHWPIFFFILYVPRGPRCRLVRAISIFCT